MPRSPDCRLASTGLHRKWVSTLASYGIVTVTQLLDRYDKQPEPLGRALAASPQELRHAVERALGPPHFEMRARRPIVFSMPPLTGLADPALRSMRISAVRQHTAEQRRGLRAELARLADQGNSLPSSTDLTRWLPPLRDQGNHGFCVGFGSTTTREFTALTNLSPGWAYRGAKSIDGVPTIEGSWQFFAMEFFRDVGHVEEGAYSYEDAINNQPLSPLHQQAARWRIDNFADLLPEPDDFSAVPLILRAALAGRLADGVGPQPVAVSLSLYESMNSYSTHATGLVTMPLPGESVTGGHAMSVVGYVDANDPRGLYDIGYFIVRNSWGADWAADNPLGHPGHALVPEAYFTSTARVHELLFCLAEPSPAAAQHSELGRLMRAMRAAMR
jgi:hypothetical protein